MKRKLVAILLGMLMMVPQVSLGSEVKQSETLADVITKAKEQIPIPAALSEFDYRENEEIYYLYWNNPEGGQSVEIECEADGDILNYNYDDGRSYSSYSGIATITYDKAQQEVEAFLKQVAPRYINELRLKEPSKPNKGPNYRFSYEVVHEGIRLFRQEVEVYVSKQTGEVVRFSGISYDEEVQFDQSKPKLSLEEAERAYLKEIGLDLSYYIYTDEAQNKQSYLAYQMSNYDYTGISAQTGKTVDAYSDSERLYDKGAESNTAAITESAEEDNGLTVEEQKEVDTRKDFIDPIFIQKKMAEFFPLLSKMEITSNTISQYHEVYTRRIEFEDKEGASATLKVNAMTGEILNYNYYEEDGTTTLAVKGQDKNIGWTNEKASSFLKKIEPEYFKSVKLQSSDEGDTEYTSQSYVFQRMVNDIPVSGNRITLSYHLAFDEVVGYYKNWSNATFKKPDDILTKEEAVKNIGLELVYMQVAKNQYALVYNHEEGSMRLDAFTGQEVDYRGQVIQKEEPVGFYKDIKGHPDEKIITSLYHSGIYLETNQLKPNDIITTGELLELLGKMNGFTTEDIESQEVNHQPLTREQGIYYLVEGSDYSRLAKVPEIFKYPYQDEEVDKNLKGYVAIAYGLGWLPKQETLKPKEGLTKAEAMRYIYNIMQNSDN